MVQQSRTFKSFAAAIQKTNRKTLPVIAKIAKEKGIIAVQFIDDTRDAYIDPSLVITDDVIKAYNQAYPIASLAPQAKK